MSARFVPNLESWTSWRDTARRLQESSRTQSWLQRRWGPWRMREVYKREKPAESGCLRGPELEWVQTEIVGEIDISAGERRGYM